MIYVSVAQDWNCPTTCSQGLPIKSQQNCETAYRLNEKVQLWSCIKWALLWISMAENQNCMTIFWWKYPVVVLNKISERFVGYIENPFISVCKLGFSVHYTYSHWYWCASNIIHIYYGLIRLKIRILTIFIPYQFFRKSFFCGLSPIPGHRQIDRHDFHIRFFVRSELYGKIMHSCNGE
jgi:hypothetical protein